MRQKRIGRLVRGIARFHLTHQNTVLFILNLVFSYLLVQNGILNEFVKSLADFGYFSIFILGFLFSYGLFTVPSSVAIYIISKNFNPLLVGIMGGLGAALSTLLIFKFVKDELVDELRYVLANDLKLDVAKLEHNVNKYLFRYKFLRELIPGLTGILTALPIPTGTMVSLLWTLAKYDIQKVFTNAFIFSAIGIFIIALAGTNG